LRKRKEKEETTNKYIHHNNKKKNVSELLTTCQKDIFEYGKTLRPSSGPHAPIFLLFIYPLKIKIHVKFS